MDNLTDIADERFSQACNCAQSVFSAFASRYGLDEETAIKIATSFGGGMARRGEVCGAVTGALMALGLARGAATPEGKEEVYRLGREFMHRFEEQHGSILCRMLLGCDISTPGGLQNARESGVIKAICPNVVHDAAKILQSILEVG
ncbi:MAG: C_GCAxxG_C_C family protein [Chloroflexi bacterium]|nr:C_GCAxxG_C_C family protein [Chloroflexota bacterium]